MLIIMTERHFIIMKNL